MDEAVAIQGSEKKVRARNHLSEMPWRSKTRPAGGVGVCVCVCVRIFHKCSWDMAVL